MARSKQCYIKGEPAHRRTEGDYMGTLLDAVSLEDWRGVVAAALTAAMAGDATARAWLGQYLVGKASNAAPTPLTVVVQQLSGNDPVVEKLARPHIDRLENPVSQLEDIRGNSIRAQIAGELRGYAEGRSGDAKRTATSCSEKEVDPVAQFSATGLAK